MRCACAISCSYIRLMQRMFRCLRHSLYWRSREQHGVLILHHGLHVCLDCLVADVALHCCGCRLKLGRDKLSTRWRSPQGRLWLSLTQCTILEFIPIFWYLPHFSVQCDCQLVFISLLNTNLSTHVGQRSSYKLLPRRLLLLFSG